MSRLAARQAGGAGRGAENIFVLERTDTRTHKNPEVGSFSLTSFLYWVDLEVQSGRQNQQFQGHWTDQIN